MPPTEDRGFVGELLRPGDPGYDGARELWNGAVDRQPDLIARPTDERDVAWVLGHARSLGRTVSVRGGGHQVAGAALAGDVVVDLRAMRGVEVDPVARRARVQGGATWADVDGATEAHGLVVPGGVVSTTGVGGLTLGGGMGWLRRSLGLSSDQLVACEVVLADGTRVRADTRQHHELFRALRGGAGGLGVVTTFEFALHPVGPDVAFALAVYPATLDVLRAYRDTAATMPAEVTTSVLLGTVPAAAPYPEEAWGRPHVAVAAMSAGDPEAGTEWLAPLGRLAGASPWTDLSGRWRYRSVQQLFDADYPEGGHYHWTSAFLTGLPDEALELALEQSAQSPAPRSVVAFWQLGGAIDRAERDSSAYAHRGAPYLLGIEANVPTPDPVDADGTLARAAEWARACRAAFAVHASGGTYLNLPGSGADAHRVTDVDPALVAVENLRDHYDPDRLWTDRPPADR